MLQDVISQFCDNQVKAELVPQSYVTIGELIYAAQKRMNVMNMSLLLSGIRQSQVEDFDATDPEEISKGQRLL